MPFGPLTCTKCRRDLPRELQNTAHLIRCPQCNSALRVYAFPALYSRPDGGSAGEAVMADAEASCFYHPAKKAAVICGDCGRFLCALCDVDLDDRHVCPACLESGRRKGRLRQFQNERRLYDNIALALAIYPLVLVPFFWLTIVTAPMALFLALRYWKAPGSLLPRTKIRHILAIALALAQITGWMFLLAYIAG